MAKKAVAVVLFLVVAISTWIGMSEAAVSDISSGIMRLHILANSDSKTDQQLKLDVRDRVLDYIREREKNSENLYIVSHLDEIISVCHDEIRKQGFNYEVHAETGNYYFPTKRYEQITLPAGNYNAVRIVIGEGEGQNWWCVMYPPLCFTKETKGELTEKEMKKLAEAMSSESFEMIKNGDEIIELKPAFKLVEWWQEAKHTFCG